MPISPMQKEFMTLFKVFIIFSSKLYVFCFVFQAFVFPPMVGNTPYLILAVSILIPVNAPSRFPENKKFIFFQTFEQIFFEFFYSKLINFQMFYL